MRNVAGPRETEAMRAMSKRRGFLASFSERALEGDYWDRLRAFAGGAAKGFDRPVWIAHRVGSHTVLLSKRELADEDEVVWRFDPDGSCAQERGGGT